MRCVFTADEYDPDIKRCRCGRVVRTFHPPHLVFAKCKLDGSNPIQQGPGTELKRLLVELNLTAKVDCNCESKVKQMDQLGLAGCREHRQEIIDWLKEAAAKASWGETLTAGAWATLTGLAFRINPLDRFGSLVDEAIRRAQALRPM